MEQQYWREIEAVLCERDKAVESADYRRFESTQSRSIPGSSIDGYLSLEKLVSAVVAAHVDAEDNSQVVAIVLEKYWRSGQLSHKGYLLYHFRRTAEGNLRVEDIAWSAAGK